MQRLTSTFSVNFYCRPTKKGKDGLSPVEMGVNVNGKRFFVNLPRKGDSASFERDLRRRGNNPLREYLNAIEGNLRGFETRMIMEGKQVTAEGVKEYIRNGYTSPAETIGYLFDQFHKYIASKGITKGVVRKYELVAELFLRQSGLGKEDHLDCITKGKVRDFAEWVCREYKNSTAAGMLTKLKTIFHFGEEDKLLTANPFIGYKIRKEEVRIPLPTPEEYRRIRELDLSGNKSLERVRDLWLFASGSGLAYCDCARLRPEDFQFKDGQIYINKPRAKTKVDYFAVLLPVAVEVAKKYDYAMPVISNQKINMYLKTIADLAGVPINLHFHLARHIYCHTLLNEYKLSYETAAKALGHSKTTMTAHYGKIWGSTVLDAFKQVKGGD